MELVLILLVMAIVLGITRPLERNSTVEESWPEASFE